MATFSDYYSTLDTAPAKRAEQFKRFVNWFLKTDPDSADQLAEIWLWEDYPGRWAEDSGIDLVIKRKDGEIWAVLTKSHSSKQTINRDDIDRFLHESDRKEIDKRLLIASTDRIEGATKLFCDGQKKKVVRFLLADFESASVDYPKSFTELPAARVRSGEHGNSPVVVDRLEKDVKGEAIQGAYKFADMGLSVGDRLQIQLPAMLGHERPVVRLIGYIHGVSIIITSPTATSGAPLDLVEGEDVVVRLFSALAVYGFTAAVIRVCKGPIPHLHLEFPSEIQGRVVRAERRIRTNLVASVTVHDSNEEPVSSFITNLSPTGCMLDAPWAIAERDTRVKIALKLSPHGYEQVLELDALIRSVKPGVGAAMTTHGIKFLDLGTQNSLIVHSYIYQQLVEHPEMAT